METKITVEIKSNYGQEAVYPACDTSRLLAQMLGTKTFTPRVMGAIYALGYEVAVKQVAPALPDWVRDQIQAGR